MASRRMRSRTSVMLPTRPDSVISSIRAGGSRRCLCGVRISRSGGLGSSSCRGLTLSERNQRIAGLVAPARKMQAGLVEQPGGQRDDEFGLLGHGDELFRRDIGPVLVPPAHEALEALQPIRLRGDQGCRKHSMLIAGPGGLGEQVPRRWPAAGRSSWSRLPVRAALPSGLSVRCFRGAQPPGLPCARFPRVFPDRPVTRSCLIAPASRPGARGSRG